MPGCAAYNCSNRADQGFRLFSFPCDRKRQSIWLHKCQRDKWKPTRFSRLCEVHFDYSQFENNRSDGKRKLKPNAIPTRFDTKRKVLKEINVGGTAIASTSTDNRGCQNIPVSGFEVFDGTAIASTSTDNRGCQNIPVPGFEEAEKYKRALWRTQKQVQQLQKKLRNCRDIMDKLPFLSPAMIKVLQSGRKKAPWSPEVLKQALQIRFAVGWKGYKYLVKHHFPLPSYTTLCRHLRKLNFSAGIFYDLLPLLKEKAKNMKHSFQADCILVLDEMDIQQGIQLDKSQGTMIGYTTMHPEKEEKASQLCVFMLRGINTNWKQVVGWHFTSKKSENADLYVLIKELINKVESCGFKVRMVTSDMGPKNQALWKLFGVKVGRFSEQSYISHPARVNENLYFCPDLPHLLKNIRTAFLVHDIIIPPEIVKSENLRSDTVSFEYVKRAEKLQRKYDLNLAPNLTERSINPKRFEKMRVNLAAHIINIKTASAIETFVKLEHMSKKALTTAWFIRKLREWFDILNSRTIQCAITRKNKAAKCQKLQKMIQLMAGLKFGVDGHWKPVQTGIIMATRNIIHLINHLFKEGYKYILTSRFNQDCIENLFSSVRRHGNTNPTAIQAIRSLKLITISQFVGDHDPSQNYFDDEGEHYIDFLTVPQQKMQKKPCLKSIDITKCLNGTEIVYNTDPIDYHRAHFESEIKDNALNNVLGSAIYSATKKKLCKACLKKMRSKTPSGRVEEAFISAVNIKNLNFPSPILFDTFKLYNIYLDDHLHECKNHPSYVKHLMYYLKLNVKTPEELNCVLCPGVDVVLKEFVHTKLNIKSKKIKVELQKQNLKKTFGSRSSFLKTLTI